MRPILCALALLASPSLALAQTQPSDAGVSGPSIAHGLALREQGRDQEALAEFAAVWALNHSPEAMAQRALAEQALGRWVEAEQHLREALALADDPWITARRALLEGALAEIRQHLGRIEVIGNVPGASLLLDGVSLGRLPLSAPVWAREGTAVLEVRAEGFQPLQRRVVIAPGVLARETVTLVPAAEAGVRSAPVAVAPPMTASSFDLARRPWRTLSNAAWLVGGVTVAFGVFFSALRASSESTLDERCPGNRGAPECADPRRSSETWQALAVGSFTTGGALLLLGLVSRWTMPPASAHNGVSLRCAPGVLGADCTLRF